MERKFKANIKNCHTRPSHGSDLIIKRYKVNQIGQQKSVSKDSGSPCLQHSAHFINEKIQMVI